MVETTWPEAALIAAAQGGDRQAITVLVTDSHPHVRRFAHSLCVSPQDAEDAAQEALIILYRKIGMLRATGALASWMFRIVRNECLRRARQALRHRGPLPDRAAPSAEEEALRQLEGGLVADVIAALPADQRRVLVMRDLQGLSGQATAAALGITTAAMKSRLHRARAAVQEGLRGPDAE